MKIKWFLMSLCFSFIAFSCSMEDNDLLSSVEQGNSNIENVDASVKVSLREGNFTKSDGSESELKNAIIFLLDADQQVENLLCINDPSRLEKPVSFQTKKEDGKSVYVVANISDATQITLKGKTSLDEIKAAVLNADDLLLLPKVSEKLNNVTFKESTSGDVAYLADVNITLLQRTARVQLKSFTFAFDGKTVEYDDLTLTGIELGNIVTTGLVDGLPAPADKQTTVGTYSENLPLSNSTMANDKKGFELGSGVYFDTYANDSQSVGSTEQIPTTLYLTFTMDGGKKKLSTSCTVKTNGKAVVNAGYKYELYLNAIISSGEIKISVEAKVLDWDKNEVDLGDIEAC